MGAALYLGSFGAFALSGAWTPGATAFGLDFGIFTLYSGALAWALFRSGRRDALLVQASGRLIERLPAGVALLGRSNTIEFVNRAFLDLSGSNAEELVGRRVEDLTQMEWLSNLAARAARSGAQAGWMERVRIARADGTHVETFAGAVRLRPDRPEEGYFLFVQEATETLHLRRETRRHRNVSEFLMDTVTHELSNSLQVVQGLSEMADLEACKIQCQGRAPCQLASSAARRASGVVADVKRLALIEREGSGAAPTSLHAILAQAIESAVKPDHVKVVVREATGIGEAFAFASSLAYFGLGKLIEEAASRAGQGAPEVTVSLNEPFWGPASERAVIEVRVVEARKVNGPPRGGVSPPSRAGAPDINSRAPLRLALASAIFEQQGWNLLATRAEGDAAEALFQVSVPLAKMKGEAPAGGVQSPSPIAPRGAQAA